MLYEGVDEKSRLSLKSPPHAVITYRKNNASRQATCRFYDMQRLLCQALQVISGSVNQSDDLSVKSFLIRANVFLLMHAAPSHKSAPLPTPRQVEKKCFGATGDPFAAPALVPEAPRQGELGMIFPP